MDEDCLSVIPNMNSLHIMFFVGGNLFSPVAKQKNWFPIFQKTQGLEDDSELIEFLVSSVDQEYFCIGCVFKIKIEFNIQI